MFNSFGFIALVVFVFAFLTSMVSPAHPETSQPGVGPDTPVPSTAALLSSSLPGGIHSVSAVGRPRSRHTTGTRLTAEIQR